MAHHAATKGHTVLMVSLEMDRYAIMERLVARYAGKVDWSMRLTPEIKNRIIDGVTKIAGLPFFICDNREVGVRHIQSLARVLMRSGGSTSSSWTISRCSKIRRACGKSATPSPQREKTACACRRTRRARAFGEPDQPLADGEERQEAD